MKKLSCSTSIIENTSTGYASGASTATAILGKDGAASQAICSARQASFSIGTGQTKLQ